MNQIPQRQNEPKQLQRLAAQRQLYSDAKSVFTAQIILAAPLAIVWALFVAANPAFKSVAAFWGIGVALIDFLWLTPRQKRLRENAAKIQEVFDCDVLDLPANDLKAGKKPDPEFIREYADRFAGTVPTYETFRNWYPPGVGTVDLDIARIICQRANCWWDAKQRRTYAGWIIAAVTVALIATVLIGVLGRFTVDQFLLAVIVPLFPTLILGARQYAEQMEAANRLDRLKEHAERLWESIFAHPKDCELVVKSRTLQDEIFENRKRSPLVFDWIFKRLRNDYEAQMNHGAEELVAEAARRLSTENVGEV